MTTAYRCREHPGETVTWKGNGCRRCERDRAARLRGSPAGTEVDLPVDTRSESDR